MEMRCIEYVLYTVLYFIPASLVLYCVMVRAEFRMSGENKRRKARGNGEML